MLKRANCLISTIRKATRGLALGTAFLLTAMFTVTAQAQTDLDGSDVIVNSLGPWDIPYTNSNVDVPSYIVVRPLNNGTRYTYSGALTGNIFVDITHAGNNNNENRFTISNTGNTFTGGLAMHTGILHVTNSNQLVSFSGGLTLDNAIFMAYGACDFVVTIADNSFGALRASGTDNLSFSNKITGNGDVIIVPEGGKTVIMSGASDYTGVTSIGTFRGGSGGTQALLVMGADNVLPATTVVEIGQSQNPAYSATTTTANLNLNGTSQTISGLYGGGTGSSITNGAAAPASLTINLADGASYEYSGTTSGNSATNLTTLTFTGAGSQTLAGNITNAKIVSSTTGTLGLGGDTVTLAGLEVSAGTLTLTPNVNMTVSGKTTYGSALDLNGANLTYTSKTGADFTNVDITNTNTETQSVLTFAPSGDVSLDYGKAISGNTRVVVKLPTNQNNGDRFVLSGTKDFTGGLFIEQGTVRVDNYASIGSSKQIDMKNGSLMTKLAFDDYTINLVGDVSKNERGAIRLSGGNGNFDAKITGVGSLEIVNDGPCTLTNTGNDYQGKTYIGNLGWRKGSGQDLTKETTLNLGASGVLPDTTVVVFGYDGSNALGDAPTGTQTLDLKGFNETVAGISDQLGRGDITSSTPATLTVNANEDYSYAGKVTDSATLEKKGTGTLSIAGANTGSLAVNEGTLILTGDNSQLSEVTLNGGTLDVVKSPLTNTTPINATEGDSTLVLGQPAGTYARQRFTGTARDMSEMKNPEFISNMDKIANTAYPSGSYDADVWGNKGGDENNTNLLQTNIVNTTDSPITLDFAYQFHNGAYLAIVDSQGNKTVVMDWADTGAHTVDGGSYSFAANTGSFTFEPDEIYSIEARLFRFNRTIGANGGGVNGFDGTLVGLGAKVSGTEGEYLPLNFTDNNWTFDDGSFVFRNPTMTCDAPITISEGASLTLSSPSADLDVTSTVSGGGTLVFDPEDGFLHSVTGDIGDSIALEKTGDGTLALSGANTYTGGTTVSAGVLQLTGDAVAANGPTTIDESGTLEYNVPAEQTKALTFTEANKITGAGQVTKTGEGTLQVEAADGAMEVGGFTVSEGRLDMGGYLTGDLFIGNGAEFSPGVSVGSLDITGGFILGEADGTGARMIVEISGSDIDQNDQLIASGELILSEGSLICLEMAEDCGLKPGDSFEVVFTGSNSEDYNFDDFIETFVEAGDFMDVKFKELRGGLWGFTGTFGEVPPSPSVPEPSAWLLLLLGAAGLLYTRKRK